MVRQSANAVIGFQRPQRHKPFVPYSGPRDLFTGAPIAPDAIVRVVSEERVDRRRTRVQVQDGWKTDVRADVTARPLRLHTREVETAPDASVADGGALGGHVYSPDFAQYLASGERVDRSNAQADVSVWWRSAYGRGRVHAAFIARSGPKKGRVAYLAALAFATGDRDAETIARECQRTVRWVARQASFARHAATQAQTPMQRSTAT